MEETVDRAAVKYDRDGDQHYDVASALIKSIRGSDVDAALHYLARMIEAGEDPRFIARRLMISASEDIGLADPTALPTAVAAAQAVAMIGFPEAALTLSHATIALALAPKSNAATMAIGAALEDVRNGWPGPVPPHLRDGHYKGAAKLGHAQGYVYPHDVPGRDRRPAVRPGRGRTASATTSRRGTARRRATRMWWSGSASGWARRWRRRRDGRERVLLRTRACTRSALRRGLEERVHRPAQPGDVAHRLGEVEACVEAAPVGSQKRTRSPKRSSATGTADGRSPAQLLSARSPSSAHSARTCSPCAACRCCSSSASWATSGSAAASRELLRLDVPAPHRSSTCASPTSSRSIIRPGSAMPGTEVEPAGDPAAAPDTVGHGDRCDVSDLQHGGQLVVLGVRRGPYRRGVAGNQQQTRRPVPRRVPRTSCGGRLRSARG